MNRTFRDATLLVVTSWLAASSAAATSIHVSFVGRDSVDPAENFDADCNGAVEANDCELRAALLEAELIETLTALADDTEADTGAVFNEVGALESASVQALALEYQVRQPSAPSGTVQQLRAFFFGTNASVGYPAAELLARATATDDTARGARYLASRTPQSHGQSPTGVGAQDSWAIGIATDVQLDRVDGFDDAARFADAERVLAADRMLPDLDGVSLTAVTGFVTTVDEAAVRAHFTALFGAEPYPSSRDVTQQQQQILAEIEQLQGSVQSGDQAAIRRLTALSEQLSKLQPAASIALRLQLETLDAADAVFWSDLAPDAPLEGAMHRSVAVGTDALLGGTVIHYFAGAVGPPAPQPKAPTSDDGCACAAHGDGAPWELGTAVLVVAGLYHRRRRPR